MVRIPLPSGAHVGRSTLTVGSVKQDGVPPIAGTKHRSWSPAAAARMKATTLPLGEKVGRRSSGPAVRVRALVTPAAGLTSTILPLLTYAIRLPFGCQLGSVPDAAICFTPLPSAPCIVKTAVPLSYAIFG